MTCWATQADADRAASEAAADKRAEFVERFHDDAADEALKEGGAADLIYFAADDKLQTLLLSVLDADKDNAHARVCALRDALRAEAWAKYADSLKVDAERLADAHLADLAEAA